MNNDDVFVTMSHLHSVPSFGQAHGFCHKGSRKLCASLGLDWSKIVSDGGIWASELEATGDGLAVYLAQYAREVENKDG